MEITGRFRELLSALQEEEDEYKFDQLLELLMRCLTERQDSQVEEDDQNPRGEVA